MGAVKKEVSYLIAVSLGKGCYRHIKISSKAKLFHLHEAIIDAFGFMDDHAHAFFMNNRAWDQSEAYYWEGIEDEDMYTCDYRLEQVSMEVGKKFKYVFDFGEEWLFQCSVLKVLDERTEEPEIVKKVGRSPDQYRY